MVRNWQLVGKLFAVAFVVTTVVNLVTIVRHVSAARTYEHAQLGLYATMDRYDASIGRWQEAAYGCDLEIEAYVDELNAQRGQEDEDVDESELDLRPIGVDFSVVARARLGRW